MSVNPRIQQLVLLGGLIAATFGMSLVVFGIVESVFFFPGVYLLAAGLLASGVGALLRVVRNDHP